MAARIVVTVIILSAVGYFSRGDAGAAQVSKKRLMPRHRYVRPLRPAQPKPPDPSLEWKDCGEFCLRDAFAGNLSAVKLPNVKGDIRDAVVIGDRIFLLVRDFNLVSDAVFRLKKESGAIETIWGIGRHEAEAMTGDGTCLWVLSRSKRYFLRKLTLDGKPSGELACADLPEGRYCGLAVYGEYFAFAVQTDGGSRILLFHPKSGSFRVVHQSAGPISAVVFTGGMLAAYVKEFDAYAEDWLLMIDPIKGLHERFRFVNRIPSSFTVDGGSWYMMERTPAGAVLVPVAILRDTKTVLADPRVYRVSLRYAVHVRPGRRFTGTLWIPYPIGRACQNVRGVSIVPPPREVAGDRFGNRWAAVPLDRIAGTAEVMIAFEMITASAARTVDCGSRCDEGGVPEDLQKYACGETAAVDLSNFVVGSHASRLDRSGMWLARVMRIRDYVEKSVSYATLEERWGKASDYLYKGRGDGYGRTLAFVALARKLGLTARAAAGLPLEVGTREIRLTDGDVWNQLYLPGGGWIDIGCGGFASRDGRRYISFEGDFDLCDYQHSFAEKGWLGVLQPSTGSVDASDALLGSVRVSVTRLVQ